MGTVQIQYEPEQLRRYLDWQEREVREMLVEEGLKVLRVADALRDWDVSVEWLVRESHQIRTYHPLRCEPRKSTLADVRGAFEVHGHSVVLAPNGFPRFGWVWRPLMVALDKCTVARAALDAGEVERAADLYEEATCQVHSVTEARDAEAGRRFRIARAQGGRHAAERRTSRPALADEDRLVVATEAQALGLLDRAPEYGDATTLYQMLRAKKERAEVARAPSYSTVARLVKDRDGLRQLLNPARKSSQR